MTNRDFDQADARLRDALCRMEFVSFVRKCFHWLAPGSPFLMNWHILAIAYRLEQVRRGIIKRLIINAPPRTLKSLMSSVAFPAFILGHDPTKRVIGVSYSSDLAIKHGNDFRSVVTAPWYQNLFPGTRISRTKNTEFEVVTTRNGFRLATSIDGTLTGRGGGVLIVDDPLKPSDALSDSRREYVNNWFNNTLMPRLDDPVNGAVVALMQRLDSRDLTGLLLRSSNDWTLLSLPAIAEQDETIQIGEDEYHVRRAGDLLHAERLPRSVLDPIRSQQPAIFAAQYQQAPVPPGGLMIKRDWVRRYDEPPARTSSSQIVQSWDTASTTGSESDFSACTTWVIRENDYYLIDVLRGRFDFPTLRERAIACARAHKVNKVLIEATELGRALVTELASAGLSAIGIKPQHDKQTRLSIQSAKFANGQVFFPNRAPWLADLEAELFAFPMAGHDDQVDSISQALAHKIEASYWEAKSTEGYCKLMEGLVMDRYWGNVMGRPW